MRSVDDIVTEIRAALRNQRVKTQQQLVELAGAYSEACAEANDRLAQCIYFLNRGFRSEAIRLCELEPKLLEAVAQLDFPERSQWLNACDQFGVGKPPELMMEAAIDLNAAYTLEDEVSRLVRKFRRQNLARAPLDKRILLLQELIQREPQNAVWQENLRELRAVVNSE